MKDDNKKKYLSLMIWPNDNSKAVNYTIYLQDYVTFCAINSSIFVFILKSNNMNYLGTVALLHSLIGINNERIQGYTKAALETDQNDLKILFDQLAETSKLFKSDLIFEIHKLDGTPFDVPISMGKFYKIWMEMKTAITERNKKNILQSCANGEEIVMETYNIALSRDLKDLPVDIKTIIQHQRERLKKDGDKIKRMIAQVEGVEMQIIN